MGDLDRGRCHWRGPRRLAEPKHTPWLVSRRSESRVGRRQPPDLPQRHGRLAAPLLHSGYWWLATPAHARRVHGRVRDRDAGSLGHRVQREHGDHTRGLRSPASLPRAGRSRCASGADIRGGTRVVAQDHRQWSHRRVHWRDCTTAAAANDHAARRRCSACAGDGAHPAIVSGSVTRDSQAGDVQGCGRNGGARTALRARRQARVRCAEEAGHHLRPRRPAASRCCSAGTT